MYLGTKIEIDHFNQVRNKSQSTLNVNQELTLKYHAYVSENDLFVIQFSRKLCYIRGRIILKVA